MSIATKRLLLDWMANTNNIKRFNIFGYGLTKLFSVVQFSLNIKSMLATIIYWDTQYYVFWFSGLEMCQMYEEFSDILGYDPSSFLILPLLVLPMLLRTSPYF